MPQPYNPQTEELYHVAGDMDQGLTADYKLTKSRIGAPKIRYKDLVLTADVYRMGDELMIHILCPRCRHALSVTTKRKQIDFDPETDTLSVEPFMCTWELGRDTEGTEGDILGYGLGLCRWRVGIDKNLARDA